MKQSIQENLTAIDNLFSEKANDFDSLTFEHKKRILDKALLAGHDIGIATKELQDSITKDYERMTREEPEG